MALENLLPMLVIPGLYALLHLTALILALVYYRRCPSACGLVLVASSLNLTVTIARVAYQMVWPPRDGNFMMFGTIMAGFNIVNWIAYGLMIVAVFVGRHPPTPTPYRPARPDPRDEDWDEPPAALPPESTGIQKK